MSFESFDFTLIYFEVDIYISYCFLRSIGQVLNTVEDHAAFIFRVNELEIGVC
jgi:hypothetical protein